MNRDALGAVFRQCLEMPADAPVDDLTYNESPGWDSINHLNIVAAIEERFGIMMETDDVLDMSSFSKAIEILAKYNVDA
jgi:acyl carrier protein